KGLRQDASEREADDEGCEREREENQRNDGATFAADPEREIDAKERSCDAAGEDGEQGEPAEACGGGPWAAVAVFQLVAHRGDDFIGARMAHPSPIRVMVSAGPPSPYMA